MGTSVIYNSMSPPSGPSYLVISENEPCALLVIDIIIKTRIKTDKTMADKLMNSYTPNDDTQYYHFCRLKIVFDLMNQKIKFK